MLNDLTSRRFGKLTVIEFIKETKISNETFRFWKCICDCGKEYKATERGLLKGEERSCGCIKKIKRYGSTCKKTENLKLYGVWANMQQRCLNHKNKDYKYYGARGIKICDKWISDFRYFYEWAISNGYKDGLTIERIDVNGNYEPSNCKWIPFKEQSKNKRNNVMITYEGETHCLNEWSRIKKISKDVLRYRLKRLKEQNTMDFDYLFRVVKRA